ncbi:MAG: hypothetical protein KIT84_23280 [Labilithrix sp.]|nr:hypothetical protein [Labilithrix sp.]MCW5813970.1 hypothetical protein [Labilithrix sp.]
MPRSTLTVRLPLSAAALTLLVAACNGDEGSPTSAAIRSFCTRYADASAFACCSAEDRAEPSFGARYRYATANDCINVLTAQEASAEGRQAFDGAAADSCIAHLSSRQCGIPVTQAVVRAEQEAGCGRVLVGRAAEGQQCQSSDDCAIGLVCPPIADTGSAVCAKPAPAGQECNGQQVASIDHPGCADGLSCFFVGENPAGCPTPPCNVFKCVLPFEEGDQCAGNECADGLVCKFVPADPGNPGDVDAFRCVRGQPAGVGERCLAFEHCAQGLYCDTGAQQCAERKTDGADCRIGNNPLYECRGNCKGTGDFGTCASFCGN